MEERSGQAGGPASALCPQDSRAVLLNPPRGPFHVAVTPLGCGSPRPGAVSWFRPLWYSLRVF